MKERKACIFDRGAKGKLFRRCNSTKIIWLMFENHFPWHFMISRSCSIEKLIRMAMHECVLVECRRSLSRLLLFRNWCECVCVCVCQDNVLDVNCGTEWEWGEGQEEMEVRQRCGANRTAQSLWFLAATYNSIQSPSSICGYVWGSILILGTECDISVILLALNALSNRYRPLSLSFLVQMSGNNENDSLVRRWIGMYQAETI